jgi:hypothetical protein
VLKEIAGLFCNIIVADSENNGKKPEIYDGMVRNFNL